ncbi:MAG: hypothetical protein U0M66_05015 [Bacilli bacterium]|nr:hypothetical protein [Bacilli bacterium]
MKGSLICEFEKVLDEEAKRIIVKMINMYNERKIVNKSFSKIVYSLVREEFEYYRVEIELRVRFFLPFEYVPDFNEEYTLAKREENNEDYLLKYAEWCLKEKKGKNHIKVAKKMAQKLVNYFNYNPNTTKSLTELVASWMSEFFLYHHDSVDVRVVVLFMQPEIEDLGYVVTSLVPLRLLKNK